MLAYFIQTPFLLMALCDPAMFITDQPALVTDSKPARSKPARSKPVASKATASEKHSEKFLQSYCFDCHNSDNAEGDFDLAEIGNSATTGDFDRWVEVYDRIATGEMPPADMDRPEKGDLTKFIVNTKAILHQRQQSEFDALGRVRGRRLSHLQLERTLHDLLGIDVPLTIHMPEEQRTEGFTSIASGQSISQHQLMTHLRVVDIALDEAFRRAAAKPDEWSKAFSAKQLARKDPTIRCREPEMLDGKAVVWPAGTTYYGRLPVTTSREDGWYRITLNASGLNVPKDSGIWCTVRTGRCVSRAPLLATVGAFEVTEQAKQYSFTAWLPKGHMFEIRPADRTLKQGRFQGGQIGTGEGTPQNLPGLAMAGAVLERVHVGPDGNISSNDDIRHALFGNVKVNRTKNGKTLVIKTSRPKVVVASRIRKFAEQAFRRPVKKTVVQPFINFVQQLVQDGVPLADALRSGYRAILCSSRFLYFQEAPGMLDDYSIASRLSYLLWNRPPDDDLLKLAAAGRLKHPPIRRQQAKRMFADSKADTFVVDLADQWLQLNDIDFTEPDFRMFRQFDLIVQESMVKETHEFLRELLRKNLSVTHLIESDFTFLNSRLARYYKVNTSSVRWQSSDLLQKVRLPKGSVRGGLMTHGAILKVTANGTNTSPVVRGVWMAEKLLGIHVPSPPENIPAIEPDIRGATTIRELLEKHKSDTSCASCHQKIDPAGFALENFDPAGQYRKVYPSLNKNIKKVVIDASSKTADGRSFQDLKEFQKLVTQDRQTLAENVVRHLIAYGTGATCEFADRDDVTSIATKAANADYGFRSLVMNVIVSKLFASK